MLRSYPTLPPSIHADLLLHIVDVSSRTAEMEMESVTRVLAELKCDTHNSAIVLNKMDVVEDPTEIQIIEGKVKGCIRISAKTGCGLEDLQDLVLQRVRSRARDVAIRTHAGNGRVLAYLDRYACILDRRYLEETTEIDIRISPAKLSQLRNRMDDVEIVSDTSAIDGHQTQVRS